MPDILGFLAPYLAQMGGGGIASPGQPTYGGNDEDVMNRVLPGEYGMPEIRSTPPDIAGAGGGYAPPVGQPPMPQQAGGDDYQPYNPSLRSYLPGVLGTALSGIAGSIFGGNGLSAASGFATNYANARHQDIQKRREQEFQTNKAVGDQAHEMWKKLQGVDLSKLPPQLSHLAQQKAEFDQKYAQAIAKDGINPKEASDLIALGSVIQSAMPQVQEFGKQSAAAAPYTSAISSGAMEPPPGAEGIAEMGLPDEDAARMAGIESMQGAELKRQQYDTPQEVEGFGLMTPKDQIAVRAQNMQVERARLMQIAQDTRQDARLRAQAERQAQSIGAAMERLGITLADRRDRHDDMPISVQGTDAEGNPVTQFVRRGDVEQQLEGAGPGGTVQFGKPIPAGERAKAKEAEVAVRQINELGQHYKPEYVGPIGGRAYRFGEKLPDFGQHDPLRSEFAAQSAILENATVKLITGAAMGEKEATRILRQVPHDSDPPKVWEAKYRMTQHNAKVLRDVQMGKLSREEALPLLQLGEGGLTPPPGMPKPAGGSKHKILKVE